MRGPFLERFSVAVRCFFPFIAPSSTHLQLTAGLRFLSSILPTPATPVLFNDPLLHPPVDRGIRGTLLLPCLSGDGHECLFSK